MPSSTLWSPCHVAARRSFRTLKQNSKGRILRKSVVPADAFFVVPVSRYLEPVIIKWPASICLLPAPTEPAVEMRCVARCLLHESQPCCEGQYRSRSPSCVLSFPFVSDQGHGDRRTTHGKEIPICHYKAVPSGYSTQAATRNLQKEKFKGKIKAW